ncbi:hypothetical protein EVAR_79890_1 [Eumeta japonica]|uniref:BED-type domain-containing protein n=1 Tax=Eumeta variegata TaxID=151549 RepID=A0A4C1TZ75_EUMVA|nr:hypothetical protein EVAR_79890_1 [Eumeta japonica]
MITGRKKDPLWRNFIEIPASSSSTTGVGGKTLRAQCKHCKTNIVSLIARMRAHLEKCPDYASRNSSASTSSSRIQICENDSSDEDCGADGMQVKVNPTAEKTSQASQVPTLSKSSSRGSMSQYIVKTSEKEKHKIDIQVAKYIYATNTPFRHSEHPEFIKMMQLSRPGYLPPNRKNIDGKLLDEVYDTVKSNMENNLKGKVVCMALDGWSNIRNEPIVCVSVTTTENDGSVYLVDTIDTSSNSHTSNYLLILAIESIKKCRSFGCNVRSFVTDNTANMAKMRRQLTELEDDQIGDVITYGCSAHLINLFAKDIEEAEIKSDVKKIIKYFKYHHFPQAKYKEAGGKALVLPQDVRWNTLADCLESYVNNWHCLVKVCSEHRSVLDLTIKDLCVLSNCTHIWKDLLSSDWLPEEADKLKARFKAAMTPAHFAAYILDPNFNGDGLSEEEDTIGMEFLDSSCPNTMKDVLAYRARSYPFLEYSLEQSSAQRKLLNWLQL